MRTIIKHINTARHSDVTATVPIGIISVGGRPRHTSNSNPPTVPIRVMSVDGHPLMRKGLEMLCIQSGMSAVAEAGTGQEAVEKFHKHQPDVVLMDLRLPDMSGVEAVIEIRKNFPKAKIIMLTIYDGDEDIYRALEAGAMSYVLKETLGGEILQLIRDVNTGQRCIPAAISARLAEYLPRAELSARELEVLKLIAKGLRNKEIAATLGIAESTVKIHVQKIFSKLNVVDRTQAVVTAANRGIIHL